MSLVLRKFKCLLNYAFTILELDESQVDVTDSNIISNLL